VDAQELVCLDGPREPLHLQLGDWCGLDAPLERRIRPLAQEHLSGRRLVTEPRGEAGDDAEGPVVVSSLEPDAAERGVPDCDPAPKTELVAALPPAVRELSDALPHGEREPGRLELVLGQGNGVVEEHHEPVACKVLQRPPKARTSSPAAAWYSRTTSMSSSGSADSANTVNPLRSK
jgi:hypothetical protein